MIMTRWIQRLNTRFVDWMATTAGRSITFWAFVGWYLGWIAWNTLLPPGARFDPYPYAFLLFLSNTIQLWYLPIITMQSNQFTALLQRILVQLAHNDEIQTALLEEVKHQNEALQATISVTRQLILDQSAVLTQAVTILEQVATKTNEIDAEVDSLLNETTEGSHGLIANSCPPDCATSDRSSE